MTDDQQHHRSEVWTGNAGFGIARCLGLDSTPTWQVLPLQETAGPDHRPYQVFAYAHVTMRCRALTILAAQPRWDGDPMAFSIIPTLVTDPDLMRWSFWRMFWNGESANMVLNQITGIRRRLRARTLGVPGHDNGTDLSVMVAV